MSINASVLAWFDEQSRLSKKYGHLTAAESMVRLDTAETERDHYMRAAFVPGTDDQVSWKERAEKVESALSSMEIAKNDYATLAFKRGKDVDALALMLVALTKAAEPFARNKTSPDALRDGKEFVPHDGYHWRCLVSANELAALRETLAFPLPAAVERVSVIIDAARHLIAEGHSRGRDEMHGWELNGERAYLVAACEFDALVSSVAALSGAGAIKKALGTSETGDKE